MRGWSTLTPADLASLYGQKLARTRQAAPRAPTRPRAALPVADAADALAGQIAALGLPAPVREFRFHVSRKWRFDLCWPALMLACEVDGGEWTMGRHARGYGMQADCEKFNEALLLGWRVLRVTASQVRSGYALGVLERAMVISAHTPDPLPVVALI